MSFNLEALQRHIPYYLTAPEQKALVAQLKALSEGATTGFVISKNSDLHATTLLQGDGWRGFQIFSFVSGARKSVRGIVLSNSCDVSPDNERVLPQNVIFSPLIKLARIRQRFESSGLAIHQIDSKIAAIRSQSVTNIFYLPAGGPLDDEYVAQLDDLHSMPTKNHQETGEKIFTLSMAGFYLFVFKLSVHFCRLHENVSRTAGEATT